MFAQRCPLWWRTELLLNSLLLLICFLIICNFLSVRSKLLTSAVAFAECGVNGAKRMCVWCCAQIAVSQKALQHLDSASWIVAEHFRPSQMSLKCSEHPDKDLHFLWGCKHPDGVNSCLHTAGVDWNQPEVFIKESVALTAFKVKVFLSHYRTDHHQRGCDADQRRCRCLYIENSLPNTVMCLLHTATC